MERCESAASIMSPYSETQIERHNSHGHVACGPRDNDQMAICTSYGNLTPFDFPLIV